MGSLTLSIAGSSSVSKTIQVYSNTDEDYLFQATWLIGDNLFTDTPTYQVGWDSFKSTYVTVGTGDNNINVDLAQWASDNGSVAGGELHSYTITSFCNNADCQSDLNSHTIEVEAAAAASPLPSVPTGLTVEGVLFGANSSWNASTNAASYVLNYTRTDGTGTPTEIVVTPTSHDVVGTLINADQYDFKVKARNVTGDSAYSAIVAIRPFNFREVGAECHHVLGDDNTTYSDIDGTHTLTKVGTGHTESVGFASTLKIGVSSYMNGLLSNTADLSNNQTTIIVGKMYSDVVAAMVLGNQNTSGTGGGVGVLEQHAAGANFRKLFIQNRGTGAFHYITRPPDNTWFMLAYSFSGTNRKTFYQDSTMSTPLIIDQSGVSVTTSSPARNIGFGNTSYNNVNKNTGINIAEGIIINAAKTDAELSAIYARSVARLGLRGITL